MGVARAVVTRPLLILADEPTGNLDHDTALGVMDLFQRYNRAGVSLLIATHAEELIEQIEGYRVFHLDGGHLSLHPSGKALRHGR